MTRRDDDDPSPGPEGGKAAARLRQFLEGRGLASDGEDGEGTRPAGQDTGPAAATGRAVPGAGQEPASRQERDDDSSG